MSDELDRLAEEQAFLEGFRLPSELELEIEAKDAPTPQAIEVSVEWATHRDELVKIRRVKRELEMTVDMWIDGMEMIQFCNDVELYGLYEAVLLLPKANRERVMHDVLVDLRLKALPKRPLTSMKPNGNVIPTKPKGLRPESIWALQKHLIVEKKFDKPAEKIFDAVLPFSAPEGVPRPYTSQDYINIAQSTDVWYAVTKAPIKYREALCQRLLVYYSIPDPAPPKNNKQFVREGPAPTRGDRVLVIDKAGNAWTWNIGWFRVGEDGHRLDSKPVMGHASFKRRIIPAGAEDFARTSFRYTRPWGQWRRGSGPVYSDIYKMTGTLILTDGMHAVVEFADGVKREVVLENLTSVAVRTVRKPSAPTSKTPKASKPTKKELSLEELMKML